MDYETLVGNLLFWSECISFNPQARYTLNQGAKAITELFGKVERLEKEKVDLLARAEAADKERDEAVEVICARCSVLPCRGNECYWYRSQKEE